MKSWNNYLLLLCAIVLVTLCVLTIYGPTNDDNPRDDYGADTTVLD